MYALNCNVWLLLLLLRGLPHDSIDLIVRLGAFLSVFAYGELPARNGARFHIGGGGKRTTSGRVNFQLNGGAGRNPRFEIGGGRDYRFHKAARRNVVGSYPVAVGYGGNGCCGHAYFGDGGFTNLYNQGFIPVPPYFALHPPVYYSAPVPRSYGYSPFPYPGTVPTPEVVMGPEEIVNPYVDPEEIPEEAPEPAQEASNRTAANSHVIRNPFVGQSQTVSLTADADWNANR